MRVQVSRDIIGEDRPMPEPGSQDEARRLLREVPPIRMGGTIRVTVKEKPKPPPETPPAPRDVAADRAEELRRRTFSRDADLIPLYVEGVGIEPNSAYPFLVMGDQENARYLPIGIGFMECAAIASCLPEERILVRAQGCVTYRGEHRHFQGEAEARPGETVEIHVTIR